MYTIKQAALRSGVSVPLLRAWERRYGIVAPPRTESGYRLYDDVSIECLRAMRRLVDSGWQPSQAARAVMSGEAARTGEPGAGAAAADVVRRSDAGAAHDPTEGAATPPAGDAALEAEPLGPRLVAGIVRAAGQLDADALESDLDDAFASGTFERVVDTIVFPSLRAIGEGWAAGRVDVAGEHMASEAVRRRLAGWFAASARTSGARTSGARTSTARTAAGTAVAGTTVAGTASPPVVLVGLPPGSRHELGALAFATAARRAGVAVLYLGADVPAASWREAAERSRAGATVVAVPTVADAPAAGDVLAALAPLEPRLLRAIGGASAHDVRADPGVLLLPDGVSDAAAVLAEVLHDGTPVSRTVRDAVPS